MASHLGATSPSTTGDAAPEHRISIEDFDRFLALLSRTPLTWLAVIVVAALMSLVEITRNADGATSVAFRFTAITAAVLALYWLPCLVRVLAAVGGGVKTPVGELSAPGVMGLLPYLDLPSKQEALTSILTAVQLAEPRVPGPEQGRVQSFKRRIEHQLDSLPAPAVDRQQLQAELLGQARAYEVVRKNLPAGAERTFTMQKIVNDVVARGKQSDLTAEEVLGLFNTGGEGERLVAIALMQAAPAPHYLPAVLQAIADSRSAFEQYQALLVLEAIAPGLGQVEKRQVAEQLRQIRGGAQGVPLRDAHDSSRWNLSQRILASLGAG